MVVPAHFADSKNTGMLNQIQNPLFRQRGGGCGRTAVAARSHHHPCCHAPRMLKHVQHDGVWQMVLRTISPGRSARPC